MPDGILNSWKEISNYAQRGTRTLQRWEAEFGFPVYRTSNRLRGSVFSFRDEIDAWFRARRERSKLTLDGHDSQDGSSVNGANDGFVCPTCGSMVHSLLRPGEAVTARDGHADGSDSMTKPFVVQRRSSNQS